MEKVTSRVSTRSHTNFHPDAHASRTEAWTSRRRWGTVLTACIVTFAVSLDSTAILSAAEPLCEHFGVSEHDFPWTVFLVTTWTGGAALLPLIIFPLMEDFGIRKIYISAYLIFLVLVVVEAVCPTFFGLIVLRLFCGAAGGVLQNVVDGIASDVWARDIHRRALSLSTYVFSLLAGVTSGTVFGSLVAENLNWRWIFYIEVMLLSSLLPVVYLGIHETRPSDAQKTESSIFATISQGVKDTCLRGVSMLFTEMIVGTFTLWSSFAFGTVLMMAASIPLVCTELYGWSAAKGGLLQTALLVGEVLGFAACAIQDTIIYPRLTAKRPNPEARLYIAVPATMIGMAGGIFLYAWMSRSSTHWAVLSIGIMFAGFGVTCIVTAVAIYVTDCYTAHAGSAISAVAFGENVFAAFLPLAVRDMYEKLGVHWAGSVLGFASLALCIAPVGLLIAGSRIRGRSKYLSGGFHRGA